MASYDDEIYISEEYKTRIERADRSLRSLIAENDNSSYQAVKTAAESIAYWQMRAVRAEQQLYEDGREEFRHRSNREL